MEKIEKAEQGRDRESRAGRDRESKAWKRQRKQSKEEIESRAWTR